MAVLQRLEGIEVASWETWEGSEGVRWKRCKGNEVTKQECWECIEVARGEVPGFIQG